MVEKQVDPRLLDGRVALVTGAGSGIGRGCALALAAKGARVFGADLNAVALQATVHLAEQKCLKIETTPSYDLTDEADAEKLIRAVTDHGVNIDILVNAAANAEFAWIDEMSFTQWRNTLCAELDSVFLVTRAAWPLLKSSGRASIINFASANAYHALPGSAALAHCAGKGGVLAMTRQLAMEGAPHGIRANTISPGMVVTSATEPVLAQPGFADTVLAKNMIKRLGSAADIGECAAYLASDASTYITGADFRVDGGATAW